MIGASGMFGMIGVIGVIGEFGMRLLVRLHRGCSSVVASAVCCGLSCAFSSKSVTPLCVCILCLFAHSV